MEKYLVTIEFRYNNAPHFSDSTYHIKTVTIGVYDDFEDACKYGNELLVNLESKFKLHRFPDGRYANKERFSKTGGCFGSKRDLITDLAYLKTPFSFFAKITTLRFDDIDNVIVDIVEATNRYREYKLKKDIED